MYPAYSRFLFATSLALTPAQVGQDKPLLGYDKQRALQQKVVRADAYGDPLPDEAIARLGTVRLRTSSYSPSLALTPDGKHLITSGWRGACMWNITTGALVRRFGDGLPKPPVGSVSLSANGRLLAVGGEFGMVFEVATGQELFQFRHKYGFVTPCLSPDGKFLAVLSSRDYIDLYDLLKGKLLRSLKVPPGKQSTTYPKVTGAGFTADGKTLVSAADDGVVRIWNVLTGRQERQITPGTPKVTKIALSPDSSLLALVGVKRDERNGAIHYLSDDRIGLWDIASGKKVLDIIASEKIDNSIHHEGPQSMTFSPDGKTLWTGGYHGVLTVWDVATGKETRSFADHRGWLPAVAIAPDGKTFAVADCGMTVRIRDVASGRDLAPTSGQRGTIFPVAVSPDGRQVVTGSRDRTVYLWDLVTGRELRRLADKVDVGNLVYSPDGRILYSGSYQVLQAFDLSTGKELWRFEAKEGIGSVLTLSLDGKTLASAGGRFRTILLIDARTGKELRQLAASGWTVDATAFSLDGQTLLACSDHQNLDRWDLTTGKHVEHSRLGIRWVERSTFSADGRLLASGGMDSTSHTLTVQVIDVSTGKQICRFSKSPDMYPHWVYCLAFSPDGRTLGWCCDADSLVHVVEVTTGQERCHFAGHQQMILSLAFSPDCKFLVSGSGDTTALVWDLTGRLAAEKNNASPLTDSKVASCWEDLQGEDAARAYTAIQRLMADPSRSVPYLAKRLQPAAKTDPARLARLLTDLDSKQFAVRQNATEELEKLGELAQPALEKALASKPSPEVKKRAEALLEKLRAPITSGPKLQTLRAIEVLEHIGNPEAQEVLQTLAKGAPEALITREAKASLDRLSKLAAKKP